ncbi:two-component sensor histidine kinase [Rhodococcus sp. ACS1]|uniref:sensor histidine kinase n=1 Tax=unclassified Rhodococcus (in: high G+C Gram-positive bacteria) TaxID=192944 RepID=UPI000BB0EDC7|nr:MULTISPECIES: ATP-binding protein [unclassified Rhodococcus (in: high G+C Gram-positive bacteria)]MDI9938963.1 ATP-binding protein [Rhodococcus sp. IEGM 1351]PBC35408.1 two-component sensor histidine kinase [Rhodococcus sp. ACS1]
MTSRQVRPGTVGLGPVHSRGPGLGVRLLLAQSLVLVAGAATCWVVAVFAGPPLFREHLHRAGVPASSDEQFHAEQAYRSATAISLAVALGVASLAALMVTWYFSRRLQRSLTEVSSAATAVANGRYAIRVTPPHLGDDFDALAEAFNRMAAGLESVETTRRQLLGDLAHEIRTPVSVLEAYMEALEDGVETLDADTIIMLRDQTRRLVRFSDDVRSLSHAEESRTSIEPTSVDPAALLSTALAAAADRYTAKQVSLTSRVPAHLPRLWADPERLGQVLGNLLDNALRHTPRGGRVEVTAQQRPELLVIEVTDTGDGISAEHLPHLFERFYRVDAARDREHGGAGIGLAIAKALVEAHGGHITARSDGPGTGSTFTITFPLRPDQR